MNIQDDATSTKITTMNIHDDAPRTAAAEPADHAHRRNKAKTSTHKTILADGTRVLETKRRRHLHDGSTFTKSRTDKFSPATTPDSPASHVIVTKTKRIGSGNGLTITTLTKEELKENPPVTRTKILPDGSRVIKSVVTTASPIKTTTTVHLTNIPHANHDTLDLDICNDDDAPMPPHFLENAETAPADYDHKTEEQATLDDIISQVDMCDDEDAPLPPQYIGAVYDYGNGASMKKLQMEEVLEESDEREGSALPNPSDRVSSKKFGSLRRNAVAPVNGDAEEANENAESLETSVDEEGLAVATPIDPNAGEGSGPVYPAMKYSPEAKIPFYRHKQNILRTAIALIVICIIVAVSVVFATKEVVEEQHLQPQVSGRATIGIDAYVETKVLQRNATWARMAPSDPRRLALEWIVHKDKLQLDSLDARLSQRYVLALLAFSFDSLAWEYCGNHTSPINGKEYEVESCLVENDDGEEEEHSVWLSSVDECDWYGVTCSNGVVKGLDVTYNGLIGEISELDLTHLLLNDNCLFGTIPSEMGKMSSLEHIDLEWNGLSGTFPVTTNFQHLVELKLAEQYLNDYWECTSSDGVTYYTLYARGEEINGENPGLSGKILENVGAMSSLNDISIGGNTFSGSISPDIGRLEHLVTLSVGYNDFTGPLPGDIAKLTNLQVLSLAATSISGELPRYIGMMKSLEVINMYHMSMSGPIPDSLYDLSNLRELILYENTPGFEGSLQTHIGNLRNLTDLDISGNQLLTGTLPSELGLCVELEFLHIFDTQIHGTVPTEVCDLTVKRLNVESGNGYEEIFKADCLPNSITSTPFFTCDCCDTCCDHTTQVCLIKS